LQNAQLCFHRPAPPPFAAGHDLHASHRYPMASQLTAKSIAKPGPERLQRQCKLTGRLRPPNRASQSRSTSRCPPSATRLVLGLDPRNHAAIDRRHGFIRGWRVTIAQSEKWEPVFG
jgi:hypothetical protein